MVTRLQQHWCYVALPRKPLMFCLDSIILCVPVINVLSIYSMYSMVTRLQRHWCYVAQPREPLMFCLDSLILCVPVINVLSIYSRYSMVMRRWIDVTSGTSDVLSRLSHPLCTCDKSSVNLQYVQYGDEVAVPLLLGSSTSGTSDVLSRLCHPLCTCDKCSVNLQ